MSTAKCPLSTVPAFGAFMAGWTCGANGKPARLPKRHPEAYERGYYAGQTAREQALRGARAEESRK